MLISANWLSRHVDLDGVDFIALGDRFTLNVAELEDIHHVGGQAAACVVGHVLEGSGVKANVLIARYGLSAQFQQNPLITHTWWASFACVASRK